MNSFYNRFEKTLFSAILLITLNTSLKAQTTLVTGDIAFTGYHSGAVGTDAFSFVILVPTTTGTVINFTDNAWLNPGVFRIGEETVTWTTGTALVAGTEITIQGPSAGAATATVSGGGVNGVCTGNMPSFITSGDQIFAYQTGPLVVISGLHMNVYAAPVVLDCDNTTAAAWDPDCIDGSGGTVGNGSFSKKPASLITGTNAIWIGTEGTAASEVDNAVFTGCGLPLTTAAQVRAAVNNPANWTPSNGLPGTPLPAGCNFMGALSSPPAFTLHPANSSICEGAGTSFTITATGATSYQWQVDNGGGFVNVVDNANYSGATTTTLTLTNVPASFNGYLYRNVATGSSSTNSNNASLTVTALPVNPTLLVKIPATASVADATPVSATFNAGSGGTGCSDDFRYTTNGGTSYLPYTPGTNISTTGLSAGTGFVFIEGRRAGCSSLCQNGYVILASWLVTPLPAGATTLNAGDIAFSGYSADHASDYFSFVLLKNIGPGTVINFTDNGYQGGALTADEQTVTWTSNASYSAGTEILIAGLTATLASGGGSAGTVTGTALSLITSGDQVLAYRGTAASPTFISGIHMNVEAGSTAGVWDGTATGTSASALPPDLITGTNAIWINTPGEVNNAMYGVCSDPRTLGPITTLRAALNNQALWTKDDINPVVLPTGCPYLGVGVSPPTINTNPSNSNICEGQTTTFSITATGATGYQWEVSTNGGGSWTPLTNVAPYSGVNTPTLTITNATVSLNNNQYRGIATNGGGSSPSTGATLTVGAVPANPTLAAKIPAANNVADGTDVSATFNAGSGDIGCSDDFRYTTNGGTSYLPYTPGTNISTTGVAGGSGWVFIEGRRANCSAGCQRQYVVLASWYVTPLPAAPTVLFTGDIAFSAYASTSTPDAFSFVLLRNIGPGTIINFTDNGYQAGALTATEETVTWTSPASALIAGTEITISGLTATRSGGGAAGTVTGTALNLTTSGDQVLAYVTVPSLTFISGIHMNLFTTLLGDPVSTTAAAWDGPSTGASASALPPGLTTGINAIWIGTQDVDASNFDNSRYGNCSGPGVLGPLTGLRAALNDQANWISDNSTPPDFTQPTGCNYLSILCPTITVTNPSNTNGTVNVAFSETFTSTGGAPTITYSTSSTLPAGLTLSSAGVLSGTPTQAGAFPIVVVATDGGGCTGSGAQYDLEVACQTITVTNPANAAGQINVPFSETFSQTGGNGTTTFSTVSTLPTGLILSTAGELSGTPTQSGSFPIVVTATDENNCTGSGTQYDLEIAITPPCTIQMEVRGNNTIIADGDVTPSAGDHTDFGSVAPNGNIVRTFTIKNIGTGNLNVTSITMSGADQALFTVGALTPSSPITQGNSATFTVTFAPTASGVFNAVVDISSNDCDESAFDFAVQGAGECPVPAPTSYTFNGGNWTNAAQWSPCYPGTTIPAGTSITMNGDVIVQSGETINLNGSAFSAGGLYNSGTFNIGTTGSTRFVFVNNSGTVSTSSGGVLNIEYGNFVNNATGTFTNAGTFSVPVTQSDPDIDNSGIVTNTGAMTAAGSLRIINNSGGTINNNSGGTISSPVYVTIINNTGGIINNNTGGAISTLLTLTNDGTFNNNTGATLSSGVANSFGANITGTGVFTNAGTFKGEGNFHSTNASPAFSNTGNVSPGFSPGCYVYSSGFNNTGGTLNIEVNGTTNDCTNFDRLNVTGTAIIAGTLNVTVGYSPAIGDEVTFINATSISGTFETENVPTGWVVRYNQPLAGDVTLVYLGNPCLNITALTCTTLVTATLSGSGIWDVTACFVTTPGQEKIYSFTPTVTGAHTLQVTASDGPSIAYSYKALSDGCDASDWICIGRTSGPVTFSAVTLTAGTNYYILLDNEFTSSVSQTFQINCPAAPANDLCVGAININCGETITGNTSTATVDAAAPNCGGGFTFNTAPGVWYSFYGDGQIVTLSLCGSSYDTRLAVYSGSCVSSLNCVTGNDDFCSLQSQVTFPTVNGTNYFVLVTGFQTQSGAFSLARTCVPDPCASITPLTCATPVASTHDGAGVWEVNTCFVTTPGQEKIYSFAATVTGTHTLEVTASDGNNINYFYKAQSDGCNATGWICIGRTTDPGTLTTEVTLTAGTNYYILLESEITSSVSQTFQINCPAAPTTTVVTSSLNPSCFGQSVTFTATVTSGGNPVTTGSVTFFVDGNPITVVALNGSGQAAFTTSSLSVGSYSIVANYSGAAGFNPSSSPPITQTVNPASACYALTTTVVSSSLNPSCDGNAVTFTATVTSGGNPVTEGNVTFFVDGNPITVVALNGSGQAAFTTSSLSVGSYSIVANYGGAAGFNPSSSSPITQTVNSCSLVSAGDRVWNDTDGDGVQDGGEAGLNGVTVQLKDGGGTVIATTTTSGDGNYNFSGLPAGTYSVVIVSGTLPSGYVPTYDLDGTGTAHTATFTLSVGQTRTDVDFGYRQPPAVTYTIFPPTQPGIQTNLGNDGMAIEVGLKFRVTQAGFITGVRFYKKSGNNGTHTGHLWTSTGSLLATVVFTGETASGWQQALFSSPVAVNPNVTYVASYFSSLGFYNVNRPYFITDVVNGPIRALADGFDGSNGVFRYSTVPAFPTSGNQKSNFWVDVVFTTSVAPDNTAPMVTSVSPLNNATGVSTNTTVVANFDEAIKASSVTTTSFQLKQGAAVIPASVSTSGSQITLIPNSALNPSTLYTAIIKGGAGGVTDLAGNPLASDYSWSFTTAAAAAAPSGTFTIFQSVLPDPSSGNDGQPIEVGVKFRVSQAGFITGIRFYKKTSNTGTHTGHLWSSTGTLLATAVFTGETASGWQEVLFSSPVAVNPNVTYVASYFSSLGNYNVTRPYFTTDIVNGPIRALADGFDGPNGVFRFSPSAAFPTSSNNKSNFWVDVIFTTSIAPDNTAPTVTSVSPLNNATGVSVNTSVIANFDEAIKASSVTTTSLQLKQGATIIPASVSTFGSQITLIPSSPLTPSTLYTATIIGGASGVKDLSDNPLAADYSWQFTTGAAAPPVTFSIFPPTAVDPNLGNDGMSIEVGVKFRVTQPGFITGIRFYKKSGNTGTHTGHLWSSTGSLLATAVFTGETASGWQQVFFSSPVAVNSNTTYVASYFSSAGFYNVTRPYFTSAVVNGPIKALANGEDGSNGVFRFSPTSAFPNSGNNASNFWVDVVFTTGIAPKLITQQSSLPANEAQKLSVKVTPNPSESFFKLIVMSDDNTPISVRITDISGRALEHYEKVAAGSLLQVGQSLRGGTYFAEVIQGDKRKVVKIIKVN